VVGIVRRFDTVRETAQHVQCFGWAFVYRHGGQFVVTEERIRYDDGYDLLGIFTADYAARHGEWSLESLILDAME
jgi:hypothetical protein